MRRLITIALLLVGACSEPSEVVEAGNNNETVNKPGGNETFNERVARQTKYISAIKRNQLPVPEGDPARVALKAIEANRMEGTLKCKKVTEAERFDTDGSIIARCADGREFRILKVEGIPDVMALDCKVARDLVVIDPCDRQSVRSGKDKSLEAVLSSLAKM